MHYLYKITNQVNRKVYIGQAKNYNQRWRQHKQESKREQPRMIINRAMKKHGIDNFTFEIIASCKTLDDANEIETILVMQYESHISSNKGYNVSNGGSNAPKTEVWRQQMRDYWANPAWKDNVIKSINIASQARTPEERAATAKLLSEKLQGRHLSPDTEFKTGHQHSPESLQKISDSLTGKTYPERQGVPLKQETKDKLSKALKGRPAWNKGTKGIIKPNSGSFKVGHQSCFKGKKGLAPKHRKLTDENVLEIVHSMINKLKTKEELAEQFGIKERVIRNIMAGRSWNHLTHIK